MDALIAKSFRFSDFELDGPKRLLQKKGKPVSLNSKTFDLLAALLARHGEVVTKDELLETVWPGQFVEEGNLTVQISALRKIFGERKGEHRFIVTVPGRGYSFVADIDSGDDGDVIIESHRFSRMVVEETEVRHDNGSSQQARESRRLRWPTIVVALLVIVGSAVSFYFLRSGGSRYQSLARANSIIQRAFATAGGGFPERVAISHDGKTLVYVEGRDGLHSVRLGDLETNNSIELVAPADRVYQYISFSPDGKSVYFSARDPNHLRTTLMRVSVFGGAVQDLTSDVESFFTFSPDGSSLAFFRHAPEEKGTTMIFANASNGQETRTIAMNGDAFRSMGSSIAWSPDGKSIAFGCTGTKEKGTAICAFDVEAEKISKIGGPVANRIVNIAWTHDGTGLVLNRNTANDALDGQVWFLSLRDGEMRNLTNDKSNYSLFSLSVSDDNRLVVLNARSDPQIWIARGGNIKEAKQVLSGARIRAEGLDGLAIAPDDKILFTAKVGERKTIWETDSAGRTQRQLVSSDGDYQDAQINVTSDNRFIVFDSNRSGGTEIWRANRDGSDLRQVTNGGGNSQPSLSPDGATIVYSSRRDGRTTIWKMSIDGSDPTQLTTEQTSWPSISPDGRLLACSYGRKEASVGSEGGIAIYPIAGGERISSFQVPTDGIIYNRLRWSADGNAILFKDVMQGLWRQNISGDKPVHLPGLDDFRVIHLATFGHDLVYSGGPKMREIILLENFP